MKTNLIFFFLICVLTSQSQNLIPNSGFEEITGCPGATVFLSNTKYWERIGNHYGSPDQFYGDCSYNGIDNPIAKNQKPYEGKGYIGFFCKGDNLREYCTVELVSPMIQDSVYEISFYVLPATGYGTMINSFGVHFSNKSILGPAPTSLAVVSLEEHVGNDTGKIISDTLHWTKIHGLYKAKGGERFATFGNFRSDKETKSFVLKEKSIRYDRSYMLMDGILLDFKKNNSDLVDQPLDTVFSAENLPPVIELKEKAVFKTNQSKIKISIWDNRKVDGDIVSVQLNDEIIIDHYTIKKRKKKFSFDLKAGTYKLKMKAINLGSIPPNTCSVKVDDGEQVKTFILNSSFTFSEYLKIVVE